MFFKCHNNNRSVLTVICITRPELALLRVRVKFVDRGDSRGVQMLVLTKPFLDV
jgi:hypothetical protein